jgi:ABC-type uncharacterized transport system involved in gliding motility auxiliary subunit
MGLGLLAVNLLLVNYIASRHHTRSDWTAAKVYTLSPRTVAALRGLSRTVEAIVFMVPPGRSTEETLLPETQEVLRRFARYAPGLVTQYVDPDLDPARAELLARKYGVTRADLREGGVAVAAGKRTKFVPSAAMAEYRVESGARRIAAYRGEAALLEALILVTRAELSTVCFTKGHGEASIESYAEAGYGYIADAVRRDGFKLRTVAPDALVGKGKLQGCTVVVIGGPSTAFSRPELDGLNRYLRRAGRLFVLLGPVLDRRVTGYRRVGLEGLLARWGAQVMENIVVDPLAVPGEQPLMTWATRDGYTDHPIGRALAGRVTVWPLTREVRPSKSARPDVSSQPLVRTSDKGWAETDLASLRGERPLRLDRAVDTPGPVSVAVAARASGGARIVVLGTERGVLNRRTGRLVVREYNRDLFLAALGWLEGSDVRVAVGPKMPEQLRLTLDARQMARVFLLVVVGLPGTSLMLGILVWWRRRR